MYSDLLRPLFNVLGFFYFSEQFYVDTIFAMFFLQLWVLFGLFLLGFGCC